MENVQDKRLELSSQDRVIGGVCGGIARFLTIDSSIIRIVFVLAAFFLYGFSLLLYLLLWIILPRDSIRKSVPEDQTSPPAVPVKKPSGIWLSLLFAAFLIIVGISLIIPDSGWFLKDAGVIILAAAFLLLAIKMVMVMLHDKNPNLVSLSIALVLATLSVFIPLITFKILQAGVLLEYGKFLLPAILILAGVSIILNSTRASWAKFSALVVTIVIFSGLGVLSIIKGNYSFREKLGNTHEWTRYLQFTSDEKTYQVEIETGRYSKVVYTLVNHAGDFTIKEGNSLMKLQVDGMLPRFETNVVKGILYITVENRAADARLEISPSIPTTFNIEVAAGDFNMDVSESLLDQMDLKIKLSHADLQLPKSLERLYFELQAGDLNLELPSDKDIELTLENSGSTLDLPRGFLFSQGKYLYSVSSPSRLTVQAKAKGGRLKIDLD